MPNRNCGPIANCRLLALGTGLPNHISNRRVSFFAMGRRGGNGPRRKGLEEILSSALRTQTMSSVRFCRKWTRFLNTDS